MTNYFIDANTGDVLTLDDLRVNYEQIEHFGFYEDTFDRPLPEFDAWVAECLISGAIRKLHSVN